MCLISLVCPRSLLFCCFCRLLFFPYIILYYVVFDIYMPFLGRCASSFIFLGWVFFFCWFVAVFRLIPMSLWCLVWCNCVFFFFFSVLFLLSRFVVTGINSYNRRLQNYWGGVPQDPKRATTVEPRHHAYWRAIAFDLSAIGSEQLRTVRFFHFRYRSMLMGGSLLLLLLFQVHYVFCCRV